MGARAEVLLAKLPLDNVLPKVARGNLGASFQFRAANNLLVVHLSVLRQQGKIDQARAAGP